MELEFTHEIFKVRDKSERMIDVFAFSIHFLNEFLSLY